MDVERKTVLELLDKLGASYTEKISMERALRKLKRYLENHGTPEDATQEEIELIEEVTGTKVEQEEDPEPEEEQKKESKPKPKSSKKPKPERPCWMTSATKAVMEAEDMEQAAELAVKYYGNSGGRLTDLAEKWGRLYTSYAIKALMAAGVALLDDENHIQILL